MERGARLAAEQLNAAAQAVFGGPLINLVVEDAATSAAVGVDRARKLVETDGVVAIVGALGSGVTVAVAESVTIPSQVSLISPASTSPLITIMEDDDYLFRTVSSDATQGIVGGQLARGEFFPDNMHQTASVIYLNNPYGQGLAEAFKAAFEARGGKVLAMVAHPDEPQPTYAAELEALLADGPDVILAGSYPGQATVYMAEARDLFGYTSWQFTDGTQSDLISESIGADIVEGLYGTAPGADPEWAGAQRFREAFEAIHGELPNLPFIDTTYDAVAVIGLAVAQAHADGVEPTSTNVRDRLRVVAAGGGETVGVGDFELALRTLQGGGSIDYTGAAGEVDFDEAGDVVTPVEVWQYQAGSIVPVEIRKADEIPAQ
jgi:ABC-type branched-subunit amino acid transport system substrate-binding protein